MKFEATADSNTGSVVITGSDIPQSLATVYRYNPDGTTTVLRSGQNVAVVNGLFRLEDTEASFNQLLRYVILVNVAASERVVQRNLITNPSFETNTTGWTAGTNRTQTRVVPTTLSDDEGAAYIGTYVLDISGRSDSVTTAVETPLAQVLANFPSSEITANYEFSFKARLENNDAAHVSNAVIVTGTEVQTWENAYNTFSSWGLPQSRELTWADFETAYITTPEQWIDSSPPASSTDWSSSNGTWDPVFQQLTVDPEFAATTALNLVTNPTFGASTAGYTASATSGTTPALSVATLEDGSTALQILVSSTAVNPNVAFTVSGLSIGQTYVVRLETQLPTDQSLQIYSGSTFSPIAVSDGTSDWQAVTMEFVSTAISQTFNLSPASGVAGTIYVDHVQVSLSGVDYFDGSTSQSDEYFFRWTGTTNASISARLPYATLLAPTDTQYDEYEPSWVISSISTQDVRVKAGILDADGLDLVTPMYATIGAGGGSTTFGAGAFGSGTFGGIAGGSSSGSTQTLLFPVQNTNDWAPGWRPYVQVSGPGAEVVYSSRYHLYELALYEPFNLGITARVLNPSNAIVLTSPVLDTVTVGEWTDVRWSFALPATEVGQYKIEIVPEVSLQAHVTSWHLDAVMLETYPGQPGRLNYLDGSVTIPDSVIPGWLDPVDIGPYDTASDDAYVQWTGTAHASTSEFIGPTELTFVRETYLSPPTAFDVVPGCEPINLTDPTVPELGAWFTLQLISELSYAARSTSYAVINRRAPMNISVKRSTPAGAMSLLLQTMSERRKLLDLVESGRVLLMRNPDPAYPENDWYLAIGGVSEERISPDHTKPWRRFTLEFQVVDRPGGLIASTHAPTWGDVDAAYTTWGTKLYPNSVLANTESWSDLIRRTPVIKNPVAANNPLALGTYCAFPRGN